MANREEGEGDHSFHREEGNIIFDSPEHRKEMAKQKRESEQHEFARSQVTANKRIAWFTGALVLATACSILVGFWQGTISQTSANAAKDAVNVASRSLCETQWSNERQMKLNDAMRIANEASSERSLQATIMLARSDQRAWVGFGNPTYSLVAAGPVESTIGVYNFGRSPATNIFSRYSGTTKPMGYVLKSADIVYPPELPGKRADALFPNQNYPLKTADDSKGGFTPEKQVAWFNNLKNEIWVQYYWGEVKYDDAFGIHHWSHSCSQVLKDLKTGTPCDVYNDTDSNSEISQRPQQQQILPVEVIPASDPCPKE